MANWQSLKCETVTPIVAAPEAVKAAAGALKRRRASDVARRGFCGTCGSSLFRHAEGIEDCKRRIAIAFGALDAPTELRFEEYIFVAHKGDCYDIADGLPQKATK